MTARLIQTHYPLFDEAGYQLPATLRLLSMRQNIFGDLRRVEILRPGAHDTKNLDQAEVNLLAKGVVERHDHRLLASLNRAERQQESQRLLDQKRVGDEEEGVIGSALLQEWDGPVGRDVESEVGGLEVFLDLFDGGGEDIGWVDASSLRVPLVQETCGKSG